MVFNDVLVQRSGSEECFKAIFAGHAFVVGLSVLFVNVANMGHDVVAV